MSILINENLLRSKYLHETGNERPTHEFAKDYSTYVEWLEEKLSIVIQEQELHKEILSKVSTKEYGEDGVGLSKKDLEMFV